MSAVAIHTEADLADLTLHLLEDHGATETQLMNGDALLMHSTLPHFGLCDRVYVDRRAEVAP